MADNTSNQNITLATPEEGVTRIIEITPGTQLTFDFDPKVVEYELTDDGDLLLTFKNGGGYTFRGFAELEGDINVSVDGYVVSMSELLLNIADIETAAGEGKALTSGQQGFEEGFGDTLDGINNLTLQGENLINVSRDVSSDIPDITGEVTLPEIDSIDVTPPDAPSIDLHVDSRFEDDNYTNDGLLTFTGEPDSVLQFTVVDDMGNTIATPAETSMVNGEFTFDMDSLPDGTYTVVATLTNAAGNTSAPQTFNYTLDQTNPDLVTINESLPEISEDVPFNPSLGLFVEQLQASEPNVTYEIIGGNDNNWFTLTPDGELTVTEAGINAGVMNFEQTGLGDGRTISIQTTDLAGNTNIDEYTLNVTNVNERPDAADFSYTNTVAGSTGLQANFYAFDNQTDLPTGINWTHQNAFDYVEAHISNSDTPADAAFIATQLDFSLKSGTLDTFSELSNFIAGSGTDLVDTRPDDNFDTYADRGIIKLEGSAFFEGGEHRIRVYSDDGFQLKVDGEVVASFYNDRAPGTTTVNIGDLTEGYHDLEIIYWDQGGRYVLKVEDSVRPDGGTWSSFGVIGNSPGSPDRLVHNPLETAEDNQLTIDADLLLGQATDPDQGTTLNLVDSSLELHAMVNGLAVVGIGIVPPITDNGVTYTNEIVGVGQIGTDTSGNIIFTPAENYNGEVSFTYQVQDDGTPQLTSDPATVTLNVTPVNDTPTATDTASYDEGVEDQALVITRADLLEDLNIQDVEDGQNVILDITSTNSNIQSITYNQNTEEFTIIPKENFNGDAKLRVTIKDQDGATTYRAINANFDPQNDAPTGNDALIGTIEEDATVPVTFTAASIISDMNFNDIDGDNLTLTFTPNPAQLGVVTYQGGGGLTVILQSGDEIDENTTYSFVPATNDDTDFVFDVTATDPSRAAVTQTATIDVLPVNDAPTLVINPVTIPEDIPTGTVIAQAVASDIDSNNLTFSFADDSLEKNGFVIDPNTGEIKVAAGGPFNDAGEPFDIDASNTSGTVTLDIKVDDNDGATTTQQLVVSITDVNDNPVVFDPAQNNDDTPAPNYIFTMDETEGVVGTVTAQDADLTAGDISYSLENTDGSPLNGFSIDQNGNITVTDPSAVELDPDGLNEFQSFVVRAQSEDGSEHTQSVQLTVQPVNEHLLDFTDSTVQPVTIEETVNPEDGSRVVTQVGATDFDYTENVTYQLLNHTDKFEIDPQTGEITVKQGIVLDNVGTPDFDPLGSAYESNGIYTLTGPSMQENGAIWSTQKLDLTQDFTITAELYFGVARGGDGITFMLHPDIVDPATTSAGANLGANVDNAVVVEFDTFSDRSQGDPGFDHIAIHTDGNLTHESGPSSPVQLYNFEDSEWHEAIFTWDATNQVFTVSFEGRTATLNGDITQHLANNTDAYFAFTGATGSIGNLQQVNIISVDGIDAVFDLQVQATSADSNPTTPDEVITTTIPVTITASPDVNVNAIAFDAMKNSDDSPAENFNFTINEMSTVVGTITTTDKDYRSGDITYSLENADGSPLNGFAIDQNGNISVTNPNAVEFDPAGLNKFQTFVVRTQSEDGSESTHTVQLTVEPINEHAVNFTDSTIQPVVIEGTVNQEDGSRVVTQVEAKDFDYTENVTYELINHTDKFKIDSQTGEITVKEGAVLDNEGSATFNALGTAYESNSIYTLTDAARSQDGAIWSDQTLDLTKDFSITADLFLGSSNGADGITFMLHPDGVDPADTALGGSLGANAEHAVIVEFDTYRNSNLQDPWQDHISIHTDGDLRHGSDYSQAIQTSNLEDGLWHEATFAWDATTEVFTVSFEGQTATLTGGLSQHLANSTNVHFGFTGTTGGQYNLQQVHIKSVVGVDTTYDLEVQATSADTDVETPSEVMTTTIPVTITSVDMEDIALLNSQTYVAANPEFQGFTQSHELLLNGDFEDGAAHWTNDFGHVELQQIGSGIWGGSNDTGNGDKFVELSANNVSKNNLKQTVTVDQNSESVTLKFDYKARADDLGTQQFSVYLGTVLIAEDIISGNEWQTFEITVPVSQLGLDSSGELTVEFYEDTNMTTGVMLDDISLAENLQMPSSTIHIDNDITPDGVIASLVNFDENSTYTLTNTDGSTSENFMVNENGQITPLVAEVDLPSGLTELNLTINDGEGNSSTSNVFVTKDTIDDIIYSSSDDLSGGPIVLDGNAINDVTGENDATDRFHIEGNEDVLIINFDATQGDTLDISSVLGGGAERMDLSASSIEQYVDISGNDGNFTITVKPEVPEAPEQIITIQDASGLDDQAALIQMLLQNN